MLTTKVTNDIEFAYHDSGPPPNKSEYDTIIVIHGHTYHSGTFSPMLEKAHAFGYRVILPNRRLYPGSTPYTKEEVDAFEPTHSTEEITKAYLKQGEYLLLFVNNVIKEHHLKNVILSGWSLGTAFLSITVASITAVSEEVRDSLRKAVKSIVWWDPPASAHGIENPPTGGWIPLYDETLTPQERGQAFVETPVKTPTYTGISFPEFLTKIDLTAGANGDDPVAGSKHFQPVTSKVRELSFSIVTFDLHGGTLLSALYGEESPYNVIWAIWKLEEESEKTGLSLKIKSMPGANHFVMEDNTKLVFDTLQTFS